MKTNTYQSRRGVTLLFVISMIVLFLLMGTTFVIVSNDFLKASRQFSRSSVNTIETPGEQPGERFMQQALYQLLRGPDLDDANSPLRGHSILADMYGYGIVAFVKEIETEIFEPADDAMTPSQGHFVRLELIGLEDNLYTTNTLDIDDFDNTVDDLVFGNDILSGDAIRYSDIGNAPGRFNGQILSFVSGDAAGVSCRIIDHQVFVEDNGSGPVSRHKFVVMMLNPPIGIRNGDLNSNGLDNDIVLEYDEIETANSTEFLPTRVVINGRPFAGTGAGQLIPNNVGNGAMFALGPDGFNPNQKGKTREELYSLAGVGDESGYLGRKVGSVSVPNPCSTNECYDAPDVQNMFLAGFDAMGNLVPSFWRSNLATLSGGEITEYSFRPENMPGTMDPNVIRSDSTCTGNFPNFDSDYANRSLDVDNTGNGTNDGIWMDINLPVFTDAQGRKVKPLVSYTVVDLDALVNVNVHGNLSQVQSNQQFASSLITNGFKSPNTVTPYGGGFGPSEVFLPQLMGDSATKALLVGSPNPGTGTFLPGRYGGSQVANDSDLRRGMGPVPGEEFDSVSPYGQDLFSQYKLFGYPHYNLDPNNLSVVGGHYFTPMDIYGRFRVGYPDTNFDMNLPFQTSMPVIDVLKSTLDYSELINNPYESDFSPPSIFLSNYDQLFTLEEVEGIYRREDSDFRNQENRLLELAELTNADVSDPRHLITTDSWEVPTLIQEFLSVDMDANGMVTDGVDINRMENLMTKLYNILAAPNDGTAGSPGVVVADPTDLVMKHEMVMENLTGFFHDQTITQYRFALDNERKALLSNDIRSGRPFDINRPFGDGIDNNSPANGVVDEPGEVTSQLQHPDGDNNDFDHDQDGFIDDDGDFARQLFARQLYVLTLLVTELVDRDGDGQIFTINLDTNGDPVSSSLDNGDFPQVADEFGAPITDDRLARIAYRKMVAQWAINVVDYRDPDSIMSPFEVDLDPFDGWDTDANLVTDAAADGVPADEYFVAWGTERPELLITESINGHDRRTEDLDTDDGIGTTVDDMMNPDPNFDNRLVPQAFSFIELYHPWVHSAENNDDFPNQFLPSEFDQNGNGVDLAATTSAGIPVWRIVIANNFGLKDTGGMPVFGGGTNGYNFHQDPDQPLNGVDGLRDNMIRRYVYFTDPTSGTGDEFDGIKVYAPPSGASLSNTIVEPGEHVVAGSAGIADAPTNGTRFSTHIGRRTDAVEGNATTLMLDDTRRIVLDTSNETVEVFAGDMTSTSQSAVVFPLESVTMYTDGVGANYNRTFSTTDPVGGYVDASLMREVVVVGDGFKFYAPAPTNMDLVTDVPVDLTAHSTANSPDDQEYAQLCLEKDQYTSGAFVILLQRLANPLAGYNATTNPYRTVDSKGSDVLCFNGVAEDSMDPTNMNPIAAARLQTFERRGIDDDTTDHSQSKDTLRSRILWKTDYAGLNPQGNPDPATGDPHFFDFELVSSLGRVNDTYVDPGTLTEQFPFAWLTWNNRPFNSAYELANVPYTSSFFLTSRFDTSLKVANVVDGFDTNMGDVFAPLDVMISDTGENDDLRVSAFSGEFPHLLNFHADQMLGGTRDAFQLHRLFDYVEVPSRYMGTETYLNSEAFISTQANFDDVRSSISMSFAPPFDYVSNYRVPGKMNINTVPAADVWDTLMSEGPNYEIPSKMNFTAWRTSMTDTMTEWQNPYRYAHARNYIPENSGGMPVEGNRADVGLFRRGTMDDPIFDYAPEATDTFQNADRNAYYRNHVRQRLGNLVTMRSSVFAIWITVGYFEVVNRQAEDVDTTSPELLNFIDDEIKNINGDPIRNRGFFIFDRSIPVAFEPGRNHNIDKAIRISSYIE